MRQTTILLAMPVCVFSLLVVASPVLGQKENGPRATRGWHLGKKHSPQIIAVAQLETWVRQLGHRAFRIRERAYQKLQNAGECAVGVLVTASANQDPEIRERVLGLLESLISSSPKKRRTFSFDTLAAIVQVSSGKVAKLALEQIIERYYSGDDQAKLLLERIRVGSNKDLARHALDVLYPLPNDDQTRRWLGMQKSEYDSIELYQRSINRCKLEIAQGIDKKTGGIVFREDRIRSFQRNIKNCLNNIRELDRQLLEYRLRYKHK